LASPSGAISMRPEIMQRIIFAIRKPTANQVAERRRGGEFSHGLQE
jgi:hypothetical protein